MQFTKTLPLLVISLLAFCDLLHSEVIDTQKAKESLRQLHITFSEAKIPARRREIALQMKAAAEPLVAMEPRGPGGWMILAEAAVELDDPEIGFRAATELRRLNIDPSSSPLAKSVLDALTEAGLWKDGSPVRPKPTKDHPLINSLGMKFVAVPGASVLFCIHETRKKDFAAFLEARPDTSGVSTATRADGQPVSPTDDHPAVAVVYPNAVAFCAWLSAKEGKVYRLPSDHEWSCAVGIGDREHAKEPPDAKSRGIPGVYPWGTDYPPTKRVGNFSDVTALKIKTDWKTVPGGYDDGAYLPTVVMSYEPNTLGIYDLAGNVSEWCQETMDQGAKALVRGSNFSQTGGSLLSSDRLYRESMRQSFAVGFRVVLEVPAVVEPPQPMVAKVVAPAPVPKVVQTPVPQAAVAIKDRCQKQSNGDEVLAPLPRVGDDPLFNEIVPHSLEWLQKYFGWDLKLITLLTAAGVKEGQEDGFNYYPFITGPYAKAAKIRVKASGKFDAGEVRRQIREGRPVLLWRSFTDSRESALVRFAASLRTNPALELPSPKDKAEKARWPVDTGKRPRKGVTKEELYNTSSIVYGFNEARGEFIFLDPVFGQQYSALRIRTEELEFITTQMFVFE